MDVIQLQNDMKYLKTLCKYVIDPSLESKFHINHCKKNIIDLDEINCKESEKGSKKAKKSKFDQFKRRNDFNLIDKFYAQKARDKEKIGRNSNCNESEHHFVYRSSEDENPFRIAQPKSQNNSYNTNHQM